MKRINNIIVTFPNSSKQQQADNEKIFNLLSQLQNFKLKNQDLVSVFSGPLSPTTILSTSRDLVYPQVSFNTNDPMSLKWIANNLRFGFNLDNKAHRNLSKSDKKSPHTVSIDELENKLSGRLVEMNHSGINFSPKFIDKSSYHEFRSNLAQRSNLYQYPTGEEWPFIIPATKEEFQSDITNELLNRNPKFEVVYSECNKNSLIQLDFKTNLTKEEAFELFPDPYGISYDGLEDFFRTVFVKVAWGSVLLRFDIGFRKEGKDFGYWMIKDGGRIKN